MQRCVPIWVSRLIEESGSRALGRRQHKMLLDVYNSIGNQMKPLLIGRVGLRRFRNQVQRVLHVEPRARRVGEFTMMRHQS